MVGVLVIFSIQMREHAQPGEGRSRLSLALELEVALGERAQMFEETAQYIKSLRDPSPAVMAELREQTYRELFFSNPHMELMWQAERLIPECSAEHYSMWSRHLPKIAEIDVVEAYGFIDPVEGYRFLGKMEDSVYKVEAMAKFGRVTSPVFIQRARELARRLPKDGFVSPSWERMFIHIAELGNDTKSLQIAYRSILESDRLYTNHALLIRMSAMGHMAALQQLKHLLCQDDGPRTKDIAQLVLIEEEIHKGNIPIRVPLSQKDPVRSEKLEQTWQDLVMNNREAVVEILRQPLELPAHSEFDSAVYGSGSMLYAEIMKDSRLETPDQYQNYIYSTLTNYAERLAKQGLGALDELLAQIENVSEYCITEKQLKEKSERDRAVLEHLRQKGMVFFTPNPEHVERKLIEDSLRNSMTPVNMLCLVRALCVTAVRLARAA